MPAMQVQPREEESELAVGEAPAPAEDGDVDVVARGGVMVGAMDKERQIPVDPVSLRHLGMVADEDSPLSAPSVFTELVARSSPLLPPIRRPTFVGASLPCSAASSPVHGAAEKREDPPAAAAAGTPSPTAALKALARQHSVALAHYVAPALSRSASRAEGRSMVPHDDDDDDADPKAIVEDDSFNCGSLCMFIPGFSKKKPASSAAAAAVVVSSMRRQQSGGARQRRSSVSRLASLERFECGSWSPPLPVAPAPAAHEEDYFAQEVACKSSCADDTEAPVKMAFVFDHGEPRGILKKSASSRQESARPSTSSQRHVRFSTAMAASCPTSPCVTPRLARARAEFNAFLEAQSA
ncbi:uncharacterized protein LOC107304360 [Oryza brachyantha]|nr:uncharacterized protein LOC107304360 [Oryza brachyantha]